MSSALFVSTGVAGVSKVSKEFAVRVCGSKGDKIVLIEAGSLFHQLLIDCLVQQEDGSCVIDLSTKEKCDAFKAKRDSFLEPEAEKMALAYAQSCKAGTPDENLRVLAEALTESGARAHCFNWWSFQEKSLEEKDCPFLLMVLGAFLKAPATYERLLTSIATLRALRKDPATYIATLRPYLEKCVKPASHPEISIDNACLLVKESKWALGSALKSSPDATAQALSDQCYADGPIKKATDDAKVSFSKLPGSATMCAKYAVNPVTPATL